LPWLKSYLCPVGLQDEWAVVNVVAKQNADRINKEKEDKKKLQKIEFRSGLEVQFKVHDKADMEKKTSKKDDFVDINQKQKKYMEEQMKKLEMEAQKKLEERQMREAEMEGVKKKREAIRQAELDEQNAELKRLRGIMEEEMRNAARKKLEVCFTELVGMIIHSYCCAASRKAECLERRERGQQESQRSQ
jgi:hypothetical protein